MATTANVVIGANYGDEGKGLMTDYFAAQEEGSVVVRFNGGCQAGHTVTTPEGKRHVFSHFGSGSLVGASTYLSRHFAVNPLLYRKERDILVTLLDRAPVLHVDLRAPVTTPFDMLVNQLVESFRGNGRHGSCGMGFGETIGRQESAFPLTVRDLLTPTSLEQQLIAIRDHYLPTRCQTLGIPLDYAYQEFGALLTSDSLIHSCISASQAFLEDVALEADASLLRRAPAVVMEGAQGLLLDQAKGAFPHVTRSNTGLANALEVAAEGGLRQLDVTYVTRAYLTRHGAGPLRHELSGRPYEKVEDLTNQPNPYQGTLRFAYLDHNLLARTIADDLRDAHSSTVACRGVLAVSCLDQVGPKASFWKNEVLEQRTLEEQLMDLEAHVLPVGFLSWGPTRSTIERAAMGCRAAA